jgi:hypothetical protein
MMRAAIETVAEADPLRSARSHEPHITAQAGARDLIEAGLAVLRAVRIPSLRHRSIPP